MKKILSIFAITAVFAACNNNPKTGTDTATSVTKADTATANHSAFADTAREVQLSGVSDTIVSANGNTYVKLDPKAPKAAPAKSTPVIKEKTTVRHTSTHTKSSGSAGSSTAHTSRSDSSSTVSNGTPGTSGSRGTDTATTTTTTSKKKGWSKAAKGAVIGAGSGAAVGAIISKKKGKGAIIGGIIGGAGGYLFGKSKDKKDGRDSQ